ncbi:uncharacterized mitochondrial protein AtMg00810-like [Lycium ferocissimum]|uniref:uncharacterized mitochondrial protein AtMg00810-like n=1 Tax=Lycium ferocissimum TaxID=112874 RepID=UPI0028160EF9|nr:uncharacterized mitochondrial protein AtMg00810-like [Lycium ferocissimum]
MHQNKLQDAGLCASANFAGLTTVTTLSAYNTCCLFACHFSQLFDNPWILDDSFKIKDLGEAHYFLGLEIIKQPTGILVSQHKFTSDLLAEFHCSTVTPVVSPLELYRKLSAESGDPCPDPSLYRKLVGKLNFLQHTRPDISFAVQHVSQFLHYPRLPHLEAGLHVLRYLAGSPGLGILLNDSPDFSLSGYCDSDWAGCVQTRRSITGFYILLGGSPASWKAKKQPTIAPSSAKAEYRALRKIVAEISWLVPLFDDFGVSGLSPVQVFCDNQAALHIARNPVFHECTKHIEIDCYFVRKKLNDGLISLQYVHSYISITG